MYGRNNISPLTRKISISSVYPFKGEKFGQRKTEQLSIIKRKQYRKWDKRASNQKRLWKCIYRKVIGTRQGSAATIQMWWMHCIKSLWGSGWMGEGGRKLVCGPEPWSVACLYGRMVPLDHAGENHNNHYFKPTPNREAMLLRIRTIENVQICFIWKRKNEYITFTKSAIECTHCLETDDPPADITLMEQIKSKNTMLFAVILFRSNLTPSLLVSSEYRLECMESTERQGEITNLFLLSLEYAPTPSRHTERRKTNREGRQVASIIVLADGGGGGGEG